MLLGRKFELTKTSLQSLLAIYDCCLAHPTSLNFSGRDWLWGGVAARSGEVHTFSWGSFLVSFCVSQFPIIAVPQSRGVDLC